MALMGASVLLLILGSRGPPEGGALQKCFALGPVAPRSGPALGVQQTTIFQPSMPELQEHGS